MDLELKKDYGYSVQSSKKSNSINCISSLKLCILILITSLFMFNSCDEWNKSKSSTNQTSEQRPSLTDEEIRTQQATFEREHAEIKRKVETKIEKLGYKSIQSPKIIIHQDGAKTNTAVKKVIKKRDPNLLISNEELGDKVYNMSIDFQKFREYEILSVKLIDEARMVYWDLE